MYDGFVNSSTALKQTASFSCPTANCTWPITTSLAICSACSDVSSHIKRQELTGSIEKSLPYLTISNAAGVNSTPSSTLTIATRITSSYQTISFRNLSSMITTIGALKAADGYEKGDLIWDDTPVTGTECALYFCIKASEFSVTQGVLNETTVASWAERDATSYAGLISVSDAQAFDKWNNYSFYDRFFNEPGVYDVERSDLVLFIPLNDVQRLNSSWTIVGNQARCFYSRLVTSVSSWW
ncbi:hypothetical protein F4782DRAFT_343872 [Xylaria castorea]|nr:hypothetical protein F4782DRAFT_343872 [Xylaria castorea]